MSDDWDNDSEFTSPNNNSETGNAGSQSSPQDDWGNWREPNRENAFNNGGNRQDTKKDNWRDSSGRNDFNNRRRPQNNKSNGPPTIIKVPSKFVGKIIGKGGSKINDLQYESGAKILVTKDTEDDQTFIKVFGSNDEVDSARDLINDLTVERETRKTGFFAVQEDSKDMSHNTDEPLDWQALLKQSEEKEKAKWDLLPTVVKNFYKEHPEVTAMSDEEVREFCLQSNNIVVERTFKTPDQKPIPKPVKTFEQAFHNYPEILEELRKAGFTKPSPIQCQAWPVLLSGEDLIGIAQTGTGKTLAFLLPALIHIDGQKISKDERTGPAVLVMAPTRELALQIDKEVKKYEYKGITSICIYGGGNRREQITKCEGVDIVIATPGRLNDLYNCRYLEIKYVTYVVLDEADRMLDMGFEPQIRKIMYNIRPTRQTVMTSATWPEGVRRLAQSYMNDPVQIYVGTLDLAATHTVQQVIEIVEDKDEAKFQLFVDFAKNLGPDEKAIVFCGRKARADQLSSELSLMGIDNQSIHGDRDQSDREQALKDIADGTVQILIATDVASRGLDIDDITHVVNYDFPRNIEEYVHRVGRTGRAGKTGQSISYFTRGDWSQAKDLISILEEADQHIPDEIYAMAERYEVWKAKKDADKAAYGGGGGGGGRNRFGGRDNRRW